MVTDRQTDRQFNLLTCLGTAENTNAILTANLRSTPPPAHFIDGFWKMFFDTLPNVILGDDNL